MCILVVMCVYTSSSVCILVVVCMCVYTSSNVCVYTRSNVYV